MSTQLFSNEFAGIQGAPANGSGLAGAAGQPAWRALLRWVGDVICDLLEQYGRQARLAGPVTPLPVEPDAWLPWSGFPAGPMRWHQDRYRW